MTTSRLIQNPYLKWGMLAVFWTLIGLSFATQFYLSSSKFGTSVTWGQAVSWALGDWYVWAVLSFPVVWWARRYHFERLNWLRPALAHLAGSGLCSILYMVLRAWVGQWQGWLAGQGLGFFEAFLPLLVKTFHFNVLIYCVIVCVTHAFDYYRKLQEREIRASELEKSLTEARLQALQMQLNPHFLFNTLHAISALMHKDLDAADRMIARLSDLLRYALESTDEQEVPLERELAFLEDYLEIERTRFGNRLTVNKTIDPAALTANVPNLVLQPLIENAIRHGIEPNAKPGRIELSAEHINGQLILEVRDNGRGLSPDQRPREGIGLSNTRARLEQLYGQQQLLQLSNADGGGLIVRVIIPFRPSTPSATSPQ